MAHVVNISDTDFTLEIGTVAGKKPVRFDMKPGDVVEVDDSYGLRRYPNPAADPLPAIVEQMSNGRIAPVSHERAAPLYKAWLDKQKAESRPTPPAKGR